MVPPRNKAKRLSSVNNTTKTSHHHHHHHHHHHRDHCESWLELSTTNTKILQSAKQKLFCMAKIMPVFHLQAVTKVIPDFDSNDPMKTLFCLFCGIYFLFGVRFYPRWLLQVYSMEKMVGFFRVFVYLSYSSCFNRFLN